MSSNSTYPINAQGNFKTELQKTPKSDTKPSLLEIIKNIGLLYRNPVYILISLCVATYFWAFLPIVTVVVDYSADKGIEETERIYVIHALTVGDLIGKHQLFRFPRVIAIQ